eukprot:1885885-Amphidinium_carterae.1
MASEQLCPQCQGHIAQHLVTGVTPQSTCRIVCCSRRPLQNHSRRAPGSPRLLTRVQDRASLL